MGDTRILPVGESLMYLDRSHGQDAQDAHVAIRHNDVLQHALRLTFQRRLLPLLVLASLLSTGCSSNSRGQLILSPTNSGKRFSQNFTQAYASHNPEDGSFQFLLVYDDADRDKPKASGKPLRSTDAPPLRQVVHVQIPWIPERGHMSDTIVANAIVDWYILSDVPERQQDVIRYAGVGFALAYSSEKTIDLNLNNAHLKPDLHRGALTDPLGPFNLSGDIRALKDPQKLQDLLTSTRQRLSPQ
jgi:hypothetical protein